MARKAWSCHMVGAEGQDISPMTKKEEEEIGNEERHADRDRDTCGPRHKENRDRHLDRDKQIHLDGDEI